MPLGGVDAEHGAADACLGCSIHWPDPAQRPRILEIRDNLIARITEAEREGWLDRISRTVKITSSENAQTHPARMSAEHVSHDLRQIQIQNSRS
jgi:hypothetical protein